MEFKNSLQRPIGGLLRPFAWLLGLLSLVWLLFGESTNAEPAHAGSIDRRSSEQVEVQRRIVEIGRKFSAPTESWEVVRARAVEAARRAVGEKEARLSAESATLAASMRAHLERQAPAAGERLARITAVDELAERIVRWAEDHSGEWLPLGRDKAPAFLASVAYHESSWRWRDRDLRGARGEGCALQIAPSTARLVGLSPEAIAGNLDACLDAAVRVMRLCSERCGDVPAENWFSCYCTAGQCGAVQEVVRARFDLARDLLGYMRGSRLGD